MVTGLFGNLTPIIPPLPSGSFPSSLTSSPSSSLTAISRSPSPPSSRRGSKLFSFPAAAFRLSSEEDEKALPGPGPSPSSRRHYAAGHYGRSRRRRMIGQGLAVISVLGIVGWWMGGVDLPEFLSGDWGSGYLTPSHRVERSLPIPGVIVGEGGVHLGATMTSLSSTTPHIEPDLGVDIAPPSSIQTWGLNLKTNHLLDGLTPWPPNPTINGSDSPLSSLGHFADNVYKLGPLMVPEYTDQLFAFTTAAFPKALGARLKNALSRCMSGEDMGESWDTNKNVWQTDKNTRHSDSSEVGSWKNGKAKDEGWKWDLLTDPQADRWIAANFGGSRIEMMWNNLPSGILRSDTLRYLFLLLEGGIYSDTDTTLLKSPSSFGHGAKLWRDGAGWLDDASLQQIADGDAVDAILGKPSVVVGIEADVGNREDWFDWWPRPIQIVQWTMASSPNHPIALSAVLRILHSTANAIEWSHQHARDIRHLKELGRYDDSKALLRTTVLEEPNDGGPVGVMAWTGPGIWTDAVLSYLRVRYGLLWTDLKGIREPLRVGDVVILPVTGFSPGVGNHGAQSTWHKEAMVEHKFRGSWKADRR